MSHDDLRHAGFKERTRVADARERLLSAASPHGRTERVPLTEADGRAVSEELTAPNPVPGYDRAAMDGYAVRAADTFGASDRSPEVLRARDAASPAEAEVGRGEAVRVHTGSAMPDGADAVVMIEQVEEVGREARSASNANSAEQSSANYSSGQSPRENGGTVSDVEIFDAVAEGENVGDTGEDVEEGQHLYDAGHVLRPSDLGLLRSVGFEEVSVAERPEVAVVPTGEELVEEDPGPGEVIETNGLTVSNLVERWGGSARYRDVVTDDVDRLRDAIDRDLDADVIVTTGGSSVGERDLIPEVVSEMGEVLVHGVALKPGHPVALGQVEETPVVMLPGYPVACIINAVQFLRPLVKHVGGMEDSGFPTTEATLTRKVSSEPGTRTFARVRLTEEDGETVAEPTRVSGSGVLSSVALADGWVVVPESVEGYDAGATVAVENWEWSA